MFCTHRARHQLGAAQLGRLRSAAPGPRRQRATCHARSEAETRRPECLTDAVPAVLAVCIAAIWATVAAEPQKVHDVWPQQRQTVVQTTEFVSDAVSLNIVLVGDDMADSDELVVPQSPNPGVPDTPGGSPIRPSTPSEPPFNPPSRSAPFPVEPVPPIAGDPPHFLLSWPNL